MNEPAARKRDAKSLIAALVEELPDDSSYDEILRELAFFRLVERALTDLGTQPLVSTDELVGRIDQWRL